MDVPSLATCASAVPQLGQNLLPTNAMPKHFGHETVASRAPQYRHAGASDATAPPQLGQLSVLMPTCRRNDTDFVIRPQSLYHSPRNTDQ